MGVVYEAADDAIGRGVALKVLNAELARDDPTALERFRREARAAGAINDPRVVTLLGVETAGPRVALAFELVPGGSLEELRVRSGGRLPWPEAARLAAELARGLAVIHQAGLVHRDVKPHNALLDAAGRLKVSDLGLVRSERPGSASLSATGELVGTHRYLAPEAQEEKPVGPPADVYGLGVTLFQLLTGRPPFEGEGFAILKQHAFDAPPAVRKLAPDVPQPLEELVLRLLSKEPGARGTAAQVADELDALRRAPARGRRRRRRVLWRAFAVSAVGLSLGAVAALVASRGRSPPPADAAPVVSAAPAAPGSAQPAPERKPPVALVVERVRRLEHRPAEGTPQKCFATLTLSFDGRRLVLGGAPGRYETWILDAETFDTVAGPIPLAASIADPHGPKLLGFTDRARGELVRVDLDDPFGPQEAFERARPGKFGATIAVDSAHGLVYASWEGGAPDPVDVYRRTTGELLRTIDRPATIDRRALSVGRLVVSPSGHAYLPFHEGERADRRFHLVEVDSRRAERELGSAVAVAVDPVGALVVLVDYASEPSRLLQHSPGAARAPRPLDNVSQGGAAIAALGAGRFIVAVRGALNLFHERTGYLASLPLDPTPSGEPAVARVLLADGDRFVATIDDPTGQATRLLAFRVVDQPP
jgi:hypothetical protein